MINEGFNVKGNEETGMFDNKPNSYVNPVTLDNVLKTDAPLAELAVIVAKLAENDVAALAELADAEANAPAADAEFISILSV